MMRKREFFEPYFSGQYIKRAALTILEILFESKNRKEMRYLVKMDCCGKEQAMYHGSIMDRIERGSTKCGGCSRKKNLEAANEKLSVKKKHEGLEKYAINLTSFGSGPCWPKPKSIKMQVEK